VKTSYELSDLENWGKVSAELPSPIRLGVLGYPVAHSLSRQMQNAALEASGLAMQYARFQISPNELTAALRLMREHDFIGINLTLPHKIAAVALLDEVDEQAQKIGAVNTVSFRGGRSLGYNTDSEGFSRALREEFSVDLGDLRVLLLGAGGGAGRAIAWQCAWAKCERLVLVSRTLATAHAFAHELADSFSGPRVFGPEARLEALPSEDRALRTAIARTDLVVNATPLGLHFSDPLPIGPDAVAGRGGRGRGAGRRWARDAAAPGRARLRTVVRPTCADRGDAGRVIRLRLFSARRRRGRDRTFQKGAVRPPALASRPRSR
jgi:shikimate dehydrogenase